MRINKYIADAGLASRRAADKLIEEGKVKVNGKIASAGQDVGERDAVTVDGVKVEPSQKNVYIMLNKPKGCVATVKDDRGRKTVMDYIKTRERIFPVGRLDYDTEGLLLLTNDGELTYKLTHPSQEVPKTYVVKVEGDVAENDLALLRKGVVLDGIKTHPAKIKFIEKEGGLTRFEITIFEGRNRQVRRMFEIVGKEVSFLKRVAVGELRLGGLGRGEYRYLSEDEIAYLKNL
jgi:pseudouridine synthase